MSRTTTSDKISLGQIEPITVQDVNGLQDAIDQIKLEFENEPYIHPTQNPINTGALQGSQVISNVTVNTLGHVTNIGVRNITAANIGAQPSGNYEITANKSTSGTLGTSDTLYPTQRAVKTYVDASITAVRNVSINTSTGLQGGGNLTQSRTLSVTPDVLRESNDNKITGLKIFRRYGPNSGASANTVIKFDMEEASTNLHNLSIKQTQNVQTNDGEAQWFIEYTSNAGGGIAKSRDMIGFTRGAITIFGGRALPDTYYSTIVTQEGLNASIPSYRYPLRQYAYGISQFETGIIVGTNAIKVGEISGDTKLYIGGGIKTAAPGNGLEATWRLGSTNNSTNNTVNRVLRVEVHGVMYDVLAREVI